ncbi:MAG: leucine-rich repeat domain-containing protein [Lachnospiraceae bacterium]|nr:leucine-rich repeat domain-containing protein [Lachnospiraceae bacterium]
MGTNWKITGFSALFGLFLCMAVCLGYSDRAYAMEISPSGVLTRYDVEDGVTQVNLPDSVKAIGKEAFMGDRSLERIGLPKGLGSIGEKAFYGCNHLREVTIPEGTAAIGDSAFSMCTALKKVNIPKTLYKLGNGAFAGDTSLSEVSISSANPFYICTDGVIYDKGKYSLIEMLPGRTGSTYQMPSSVSYVAPYAFWGVNRLKALYLSQGLKALTPFSITNASSLEFVYVPSAVSGIQEYAFRDCGNLKYVGIGNRRATVDASAFKGVNASVVKETGVSQPAAEKAYMALGGRVEESKIEAEEAKPSKRQSSSVSENGKRVVPGNSASQNSSSSDSASTSGEGSGQGGSSSSGNGSGNKRLERPWGVNSPYKELDRSSPGNLYGIGRIVDGKTLIIPVERQ